jgi:hypothetical protein
MLKTNIYIHITLSLYLLFDAAAELVGFTE